MAQKDNGNYGDNYGDNFGNNHGNNHGNNYGGQFSPTPQDTPSGDPKMHPFRGKKRTRVGGRVNALFVVPLPFAGMAFFQGSFGLVGYLAAFAVLILAAWMTREGEIAHEAYEARKVARRPAMPRKIFGSFFTGVGLAIAGFVGHGLIDAAIFGVLGAVLHSAAFGFDPLKDKGAEGIDQFQQDRVARVVEEAEAHLAAMSDAIRRAEDRKLEARVDRFQSIARDLFRTVEEDPRDLTAARKFLGVYLMGARDATVKFADIYARSQNAQARADYEVLLDDLETNFAARTQKLLSDDNSDLNVEIETLRDRLAREGV